MLGILPPSRMYRGFRPFLIGIGEADFVEMEEDGE
jgi:hypothetical protein